MRLRKWYQKAKSILGLFAFIATGGGLIVSTARNQSNFYKTEILFIFGALFAVSLVDQFIKLLMKDERDDTKVD